MLFRQKSAVPTFAKNVPSLPVPPNLHFLPSIFPKKTILVGDGMGLFLNQAVYSLAVNSSSPRYSFLNREGKGEITEFYSYFIV